MYRLDFHEEAEIEWVYFKSDKYLITLLEKSRNNVVYTYPHRPLRKTMLDTNYLFFYR